MPRKRRLTMQYGRRKRLREAVKRRAENQDRSQEQPQQRGRMKYPTENQDRKEIMDSDDVVVENNEDNLGHNFKWQEAVFASVKEEQNDECKEQNFDCSSDIQTVEDSHVTAKLSEDDESNLKYVEPEFVAVKEEHYSEESSNEEFYEDHLEYSEYDLEKSGGQNTTCTDVREAGPSSTPDKMRMKILETSEGEKRKKYPCSKCEKSFRDSYELKLHFRHHTNERPFPCIECGKDYITKGALRQHLLIHAGVRPHSCEQCGMAFVQKSDLKVHLRVHSGETPYQCMYCGKQFGNISNLNQHVRIHTGTKPFVCSVCAKAFVHKGHLQRHMRTHTGERPFHCSECGKNFADSTTMNRHRKRHLGKKLKNYNSS